MIQLHAALQHQLKMKQLGHQLDLMMGKLPKQLPREASHGSEILPKVAPKGETIFWLFPP